MERQATQPTAVPSGRKRRRVSSKKPKGETPASDMIGLSPAEALDVKATQPPTSELVVALKALPRAEDPLPSPTPSPVCSVNELMEGKIMRKNVWRKGRFIRIQRRKWGNGKCWTRWTPS